MMKPIVIICLIVCAANALFAQGGGDSLVYQAQRNKINSTMAVRVQKFHEYEVSLNMHSGLFGAQTKNDIRHSDDLLIGIIKTDDTLVNEIRLLLNVHAFGQRGQTQTAEGWQKTLSLQHAISRLKGQVNLLFVQTEKQREKERATKWLLIIIASLTVMSIFLLLINRKKRVL